MNRADLFSIDGDEIPSMEKIDFLIDLVNQKIAEEAQWEAEETPPPPLELE